MGSAAIEMEVKALVERFSRIEGNKDSLVEGIEKFFEQRKKEGKKELPVKMTQLQNLMGRANETKSVKEIVNFIRYQIGRDTKHRDNRIIQEGWAEDDFGNQVIKEVEKVAALAGGDKEMSIKLVRLFLGYLQRHARYLWAGKPEEREPEEE